LGWIGVEMPCWLLRYLIVVKREDDSINAKTVDTDTMSIDPKEAAKSKDATATHSKLSCEKKTIITVD
jgi:hypothetical protein